MKSEGSVRHQLSQVLFRYRKKMTMDGLAPLPHNCKHNLRLPLLGKTLGACGYKEGTPEANRTVCDTNLCPEQARTCPFFSPKYTPEELKEIFQHQFEDLLAKARLGDSGYLARNYPDIAALLWVLEEDPQQTTIQNLENTHVSAPTDPSTKTSSG